MELSIIIVNYNSGDVIIKCLSSIYDNIKGITFEILLIDNFSSDDSVKRIKELFAGVHVIENSKNLGFSRACNQGIKSSSGDFILFLNPDILIAPSPRNFGVAFYLRANKHIGLLGCKLINPDGSVQDSCRRFPDILTIMFRRIRFFQLFPPFRRRVEAYLRPVLSYEKVQTVDWLLGAFMLTGRDVIDKAGTFDERFFIYFEDVDFCRRVWKSGYEVCYYPFMEVFHHHKRESAKGLNRLLLLHLWSGVRYFWKWSVM